MNVDEKRLPHMKTNVWGNLFEPFGETLLETGLLQPMVLEQGEESLLFLFAFVCVFFPLYLKCLERLCLETTKLFAELLSWCRKT